MYLISGLLTLAIFIGIMFQVAPMIKSDWAMMIFDRYASWILVFLALVWLHIFFIVGVIARLFRPEALGIRLRRAESEQEDQIRRLSEAVLKEKHA